MPVILEILEQENVEFVRNSDGSYLRTQGFGQPGKWWINIARGQTLKRKVARRVRAEGANVLNYILVTKLLRTGNQISGCLGYHVLTGEFISSKPERSSVVSVKPLTESPRTPRVIHSTAGMILTPLEPITCSHLRQV